MGRISEIQGYLYLIVDIHVVRCYAMADRTDCNKMAGKDENGNYPSSPLVVNSYFLFEMEHGYWLRALEPLVNNTADYLGNNVIE